MKVTWLSHRDIQHPACGGAERTASEICSRLAAKGHEVQLVSTAWPGARRSEWIRGYNVSRLGRPVAAHIRVVLRRKVLVQNSVVVEDLAHVMPWLGSRLSERPGVAYFRHLHARTLSGQVTPLSAALLKRVESDYSRIYRGWTFVSESVGSMSDLSSLNVPSNLLHRIPPGVDLDLFSPGEQSVEGQILYFGGLRAYKRPADAVRSLAEVVQRGIQATLVVVGVGPELTRLRAEAGALGVLDRVFFVGRLSDRELSDLIRCSRVSVLTSRHEGWGLAAIEAAACGVPTVAYKVAGLQETVAHQKSGVLVESDSPNDLADALVRVLSSPRAYWSGPCRDWARNFDWSRTAESWEKLLASLG